jgi:membrane protein DedA with SNARE-associated domain
MIYHRKVVRINKKATIFSMNHLPDQLSHFLTQYGNLALFGLLALGIVGLPIPEETLLIFSGYLIAKGTWSIVPTVLAAIGGSICGITVSYALGVTAGNYLVRKYGYLIGITEERIQNVHNWFDRLGKWLLFFGYFILGVRHLTGYVAGSTLLRYRKFALFAYTGAIAWCATFLSLGYFFSDKIEYLIQKLDVAILVIFIALLILLFYLIRVMSKKH